MDKANLVDNILDLVCLQSADKMDLYREKAEEYCNLIDEGKFEDAVAMFNRIACDDMKNMYKSIFEG